MISNEMVGWGTNDLAKIPDSFRSAASDLKASLEGLELGDMFQRLDEAIERGVVYAQESVLYTAYAVALQKDVWDKMGMSDQHAIADSFYQYISTRFGISDNATTVDNYIHTANLWLLGKIEPPNEVLLFEVENGRAVPVTDKEGDSTLVEVTPWDVNYSKLLVANNRAIKGAMSEEDWGLLFNPEVSQGKLIGYWRGPKPEPKEKDPEEFTYTMVGSWLCVTNGEEVVQLAEVDDDTIKDNILARQGWLRLKAVMKVAEEEDF